MRFYTTDEGDANWAPVAMIMAVLVIALLMGYFFLYAPSQQTAVAPTVNVNSPSPTDRPSTTIVLPGQKGETGDTGKTGNTGNTGATGAPGGTGTTGDTGDKGTPGAPGAPGAPGSPGQPGAPGTPGSPPP
ncbi:MAG: hypothetical protein ABJA67_13710 [Chthonomonadales bacterium]